MNRRILSGLAVACAAAAIPFAVANAEPEIPNNPVEACEWLEENIPEAYEFIATQPGACESSIASVGVEALMAGAFPSTATAVGNCKFLEANFFGGNPDMGLPDYLDDGKTYPYQFYWFEGLDDPNLYAKNRADCVRIVELLHGGYFGD